MSTTHTVTQLARCVLCIDYCEPIRAIQAVDGRQILRYPTSNQTCFSGPGIMSCCKDLANQVWHSQSYVDSLTAVGLDRHSMKFLSIPAAEYFSGAAGRDNDVSASCCGRAMRHNSLRFAWIKICDRTSDFLDSSNPRGRCFKAGSIFPSLEGLASVALLE